MPFSHKEIDDYLLMIAQPLRLEILIMLKGGELCVCDIQDRLSVAQNLVSHHLSKLAEFGLLTKHKEGVKVIYQRNEKEIIKYQILLTKTLKLHENTSTRNRLQDLPKTTRKCPDCR